MNPPRNRGYDISRALELTVIAALLQLHQLQVRQYVRAILSGCGLWLSYPIIFSFCIHYSETKNSGSILAWRGLGNTLPALGVSEEPGIEINPRFLCLFKSKDTSEFGISGRRERILRREIRYFGFRETARRETGNGGEPSGAAYVLL